MTHTRTWKRGVLGLTAALALVVAGALRAHDMSALEKKVHSACVDKLGKDAEPIRVTVTGDKATLTGEVALRPVQELCKEVALSIPGIKHVDNDVKLARQLPLTGKVKDETLDAKLEMQVKGRLEARVGTRATRSLEVEVVDGWVSLRGTLDDAEHKDLAIREVQTFEGVNRVIDLIEVAKK